MLASTWFEIRMRASHDSMVVRSSAQWSLTSIVRSFAPTGCHQTPSAATHTSGISDARDTVNPTFAAPRRAMRRTIRWSLSPSLRVVDVRRPLGTAGDRIRYLLARDRTGRSIVRRATTARPQRCVDGEPACRRRTVHLRWSRLLTCGFASVRSVSPQSVLSPADSNGQLGQSGRGGRPWSQGGTGGRHRR